MKEIDIQFDSLVHCTKLSKKNQQKLINWFARQNILVQIDIFSEQKNQFFKVKNQHENLQVVPLAAFLLSIQYFYELETSKNGKSTKTDLTESGKISKFSIKKAKKEKYKEKREKLLDLRSVILELKKAGASLRDISDYLRGRHHFVVSHTYIRDLWEELKNGK